MALAVDRGQPVPVRSSAPDARGRYIVRPTSAWGADGRRPALRRDRRYRHSSGGWSECHPWAGLTRHWTTCRRVGWAKTRAPRTRSRVQRWSRRSICRTTA
eukprot:3934342-Prymnesium_polylepis.1